MSTERTTCPYCERTYKADEYNDRENLLDDDDKYDGCWQCEQDKDDNDGVPIGLAGCACTFDGKTGERLSSCATHQS